RDRASDRRRHVRTRGLRARCPHGAGAGALPHPDAGALRSRCRTGPRPRGRDRSRRDERTRAQRAPRARAGRSLTADAAQKELLRGVAHVFPEDALHARLRTGRPLRVKLGVDPTAADIHLGHTVVLTKLRQFQDLGHHAVLIIGDFTALSGDPSGRSATRPPLSRAEVEAHARTYEAQVFKVLRRERTEVRRNTEWLAPLALEEVIRLAAKM